MCVTGLARAESGTGRTRSSSPTSNRPVLTQMLLICMRRSPDPTGLYAIVSEDEGEHWSSPVCIRDDTIAAGPRGTVDRGYPVAIQMKDGRISVAYYWQHQDTGVLWHGGRKFIGGSLFASH